SGVSVNSASLGGLGRGVGHSTERFLTPNDVEPSPAAEVRTVRSLKSALMTSSVTPPDPRQAQWTIAAQPGVKIGVRLTGWYRVAQPALGSAGSEAHGDPSAP